MPLSWKISCLFNDGKALIKSIQRALMVSLTLSLPIFLPVSVPLMASSSLFVFNLCSPPTENITVTEMKRSHLVVHAPAQTPHLFTCNLMLWWFISCDTINDIHAYIYLYIYICLCIINAHFDTWTHIYCHFVISFNVAASLPPWI